MIAEYLLAGTVFAKTLQPAKKPIPEHLIIPAIKLTLPVTEAPIEDNSWAVRDKNTAFYGRNSALLEQPGTTVLFAHAKKNLFARLPLVTKRSRIAVLSQGRVYVYQLRERFIVNEDSTGFITYEGEHKIALLTCFGKNSEKRLVYTGELIYTTQKSAFLMEIKNI